MERHGVTNLPGRGFVLGDADELRELAQRAGFQAIDIRAENKLAYFTSPKELVDHLAAGGLGTCRAFAEVSESERNAIVDEVSTELSPYVTEDGLAYPNACNILLAHP